MKIQLGNLGPMTTEFAIDQVAREGDHLTLTLKALDPVTWYAQVAVDYADLKQLARLIPKRSLLSFLLLNMRIRKSRKPLSGF